MIRAAVDGVVDYSKADLRDPKWHLRLQIMMRQMMENDRKEFAQVRMQRESAYLVVPNIDPKAWEHHRDDMWDAYQDLFNIIFCKEEKVERKELAADRATQQWSMAFGDPESTETKEQIDAVAASLRRVRLSRKRAGNYG